MLATSVAPVNNIADKLFSVNLNLIDLIIRASTTQRSSAVSSEWFSVDGMRLYGALWCKAHQTERVSVSARRMGITRSASSKQILLDISLVIWFEKKKNDELFYFVLKMASGHDVAS